MERLTRRRLAFKFTPTVKGSRCQLRHPTRRLSRPRLFASNGVVRAILLVLGVGGFIGLLVIGSQQAGLGDYARVLAIVWFLSFGLMRCQIKPRPMRSGVD